MKDRQRERIRTLLTEMRKAVIRQGDASIEPNRSDPTAKVDDDAQPLNEMGQVIASRRNQVRAGSLAQIDEALQRLDADPDEFGLCLDCEEEIPLRRLELMPFAKYCVQCQSERDDPRNVSRRKLTDFV